VIGILAILAAGFLIALLAIWVPRITAVGVFAVFAYGYYECWTAGMRSLACLLLIAGTLISTVLALSHHLRRPAREEPTS
jgi:hypothetical protein